MSIYQRASLSERARATLLESALEEVRAVAGRSSRVVIATGSEERMTVAASTVGKELTGASIWLRGLPSGQRGSLLEGHPIQTGDLGTGLGLPFSSGDGPVEAFICPLVAEGHLVGLLGVELPSWPEPDIRETLVSLGRELAYMLGRIPGVGDSGPDHPEKYEGLQPLMLGVSEVVTIMEANGSVRYVSPNVERVLGYSPEEYVGKEAFAYVHPSDRERVSKSFSEDRDSEPGANHSMEFQVLHADGSWRLMEISASNLLDDPKVGGIVVTSRDITEHRQTERELKESEERLRAVIQQAAEGMLLVDLDTRRILETNTAYRELLGYTADELSGMTLYDVVAHDRESVDAYLRQVTDGEARIGERRQRRKNGSLVDVVVSASLVSYAGRLVVSGVVRDVTEQKRMEQALRGSEQRFRALVEQAADALFLHDLDGKLVDVNQRAYESLGYTRDELLRLSVQDIEQNIEPEGFKKLWERVTSEGRVILDGDHRRKDGSVFPVEIHVGILEVGGESFMLAAGRDITERREMEETLRKREANLARAQQVSNLGSWEARMVENGASRAEQEMYWSDELYRIFGYEPQQFVPSFETMMEATHPQDMKFVGGAMGEALSRRDPLVNIEHRILHPDGEIRSVLARIEITYDESGGPTGQTGTLLDVTEHKRAEERLKSSENRLSEAQRIAHVGSWEYDVAEDKVLWSDEMYRIFGYEPQSFHLTYREFLKLVHPEDRGLIKEKIRRASYKRSDSLEYRLIRPTGEERYVQGVYELVYDKVRRAFHMVGTLQDITGRKALEERLGYQAFHDSLTGLPNRALFEDRLGHALSRRDGEKFMLLFVDLDNFKDVNDTLGHEAGDELLVEVGRRLRDCMRQGDTVARFGGDEFIMLLEGLGALEDAHGATERVTASLEAPVSVAGQELLITASIGVSRSSSGDGGTPGSLLRDADVALYQAKEAGGAGYEMFDPGMNLKSVARLNLAAELHQAVGNEQLVLHYQPKVDLTTDQTLGVEALLRWVHPEWGMVSPAEFIPVAEETGAIRHIGRWVLREACRQLKEWQDRGSCCGRLSMSVNISARQFRHSDLAGEVIEVLEETGIHPESLVLELTESTLVWNVEYTVQTLQRLKEIGVRVSIDDFGTGYSNLAYLTRFPVDELKIDKSFVEGMNGHDGDTAIVQAVIDLSRNLGLQVIAEGIEKAEHVDQLQNLGCWRGQGYYFARPEPASELEGFL